MAFTKPCIIALLGQQRFTQGPDAVLWCVEAGERVESQAREELMQQLNESYNAKPGKGWRFFHAESGAHPFSGWLSSYLAGTEDFMEFSNIAVEHLQKLMEESNEESAREKTNTLVSYAMAQAKLGEPVTFDELSGLLDEGRPRNFAEFIQGKDYGLSASIPPDKKTLNTFRRFTGRAEGLSISSAQACFSLTHPRLFRSRLK